MKRFIIHTSGSFGKLTAHINILKAKEKAGGKVCVAVPNEKRKIELAKQFPEVAHFFKTAEELELGYDLDPTPEELK